MKNKQEQKNQTMEQLFDANGNPVFDANGNPVMKAPEKKKSKKGLIIALSIIGGIILLIIIIAACAGGSDSDTQSGSSTTVASGEVKSSEETVSDKGDVGDYYVEIKSATKGKDYDGKDVVIIEYTFKNNSDSAANFMTTVDDGVYQDGVELETAIMTDESNKYDNEMKDIKPGKTLQIYKAYNLSSSSKVEVEVCKIFSEKISLKKDFSINK